MDPSLTIAYAIDQFCEAAQDELHSRDPEKVDDAAGATSRVLVLLREPAPVLVRVKLLAPDPPPLPVPADHKT